MFKVTECSTTTEYDRAMIKWTIDELSLIKVSPKKILVSEQFSTCVDKNRNNWELHLNNNKVYLILYKERDDAVIVKYEIYILNPNGDKTIVQEKTKHTFTPTQGTCKYIKSPDCDITDKIFSFKKRSKVGAEYNKITVCCEVIELGSSIRVMNKKESKKSVFFDDYKNLWATNDAADVTLFVGDEEFKAHKAILIARSPIFRAMITIKQENNENIAKITDIDAGIIKAMLEYIYTDTVEDLDRVAFDLLAAADKYQLDHLKSLCEASLTKSINVTNVMQLLVWADRHRSTQLVQDVIEFFKTEEGVGLIATKQFEDMVKSYPHLSLLMLRKNVGV